jgi:hypothetical protein
MDADLTPVFEEKEVGGRTLVVCTIDGETGAARIFSKGLEDAKQRAEAQARAKIAARPPTP